MLYEVITTLQAIPGKTFNGIISFIDPILDKTTRTAKIRVEVSNPDLRIKPEMYATAKVNARLQQYVITSYSIHYTKLYDFGGHFLRV